MTPLVRRAESQYDSSLCHQKLSSSLKERLKRTRRSFTSPFSVAKRLCVVDLKEDDQQVSADPQETVNPQLIKHCVDVNSNEAKLGSERFSGPFSEPAQGPSQDFAQKLDQVRKEVKDKTETLRRLKMVKMYRSKNDLTQLQTLIDKWRSCAQAALYELQSEVPIDGRKASLSELIDLFGLDDSILHFDRTEEDFTT
uniref:Swi5-dependent recombination DNA repair protein 1 homolog n=1 Tax=Mastacembelus armatus TaxID=205130 RepID=A0A3Q3MU30_9TELE